MSGAIARLFLFLTIKPSVMRKLSFFLTILTIVCFLPSCKKELQSSNRQTNYDPPSASRIASGSSNLLWQKCLGSSGNDDGTSIAVAKDATTGVPIGYFLVGTAGANDGDVSGNHGLVDAWVVKRNLDGSPVWQLAIGGSGYDYGKGVVATDDGGCIVAIDGRSTDGDFNSLGSSPGLVVVKLSSTGTVVWVQRYGTGTPNAMIKTSDGGVAITGYVSGADAVDPQESMFLIKLNPDPNATTDQPYSIRLNKTYGFPTGTHGETGYSVCETATHGFALTGASYSAVNSNPRFYVVGTGADGSEIWNQIFTDGSPDIGWGITAAPDGYLVATGRMSANMVVIKLNTSTGVKVWQTTYLGGNVGSITGFSIVCTNQDCVITGSTNSNKGEIKSTNGGEDLILLKLGLDGTKKTSYSFGGTGNDRGRCIIPSADGTNTYLALGYTNSNNGAVSGNHGGQDMWLVKLNTP
jgi:hypothetical protein